MVYRHFVIFGRPSELQSMGTECAGEQGGFWQFHDRIYQIGALHRTEMIEFANSLGMDVPRFTACLDEERYKEAIDEDIEYGLALDVSAVPTILIVGAGEYIQIVGGYTPADLGDNFDRLLARLENQ